MGYANRDIIRACEVARKEGRASFEAILAAVRATQAECPHPEKDCTRGAPPDMEDIVWCRRCSSKLEGPYPVQAGPPKEMKPIPNTQIAGLELDEEVEHLRKMYRDDSPPGPDWGWRAVAKYTLQLKTFSFALDSLRVKHHELAQNYEGEKAQTSHLAKLLDEARHELKHPDGGARHSLCARALDLRRSLCQLHAGTGAPFVLTDAMRCFLADLLARWA